MKNGHGSTPRFWYSENTQAFQDWLFAREQIMGKTPMETVALQAQIQNQLQMRSSSIEGERKPTFGDGSQDYMMQRYKNLAIIQVSGNLVKSDSYWNRYFGQVSYDEIRRSVIMALQDNTVQGIVACMATPGGAASGADAMATFFSKADHIKPFYSFAETDMCSGGYYLGAPSREIYAQRAALVGSIGVLMVHMDVLNMYKEIGITPTVFRAGQFKALGTPYEHLDKPAKENIQSTLNSFFHMFNNHVVACRDAFGSEEELLAEAGEGRVFLAEDAKEVGLVDQVMEMEDAYEDISEKVRASNGGRTTVSATNMKRGSTMGVKAKAPAAPVLSAEQLAILAAGGTLPEAQVEGEEVETTESTTDVEVSTEATVTADAPAAPEAPAATVQAPAATVEAPAPAAAVATGVDVDKLVQLSTDLAQARVDLKAEQTAKADLQTQYDAQAKTIAGLQAIVVSAIGHRQVALGFQPSDVSAMSPDQQIQLYDKLDADFKERFKAGQVSRPTAAAVEPASLSPAANAARGMTGKL